MSLKRSSNDGNQPVQDFTTKRKMRCSKPQINSLHPDSSSLKNNVASSKLKKNSKNISWNEIKSVQNLIERCLQQYMTQTEIVTALQIQANIEPSFTYLVWQKLEEQNPSFFHAYNIYLKMKDQIVAFNYLVNQQVQVSRKLASPSMNGPPESEEIQIEVDSNVASCVDPKNSDVNFSFANVDSIPTSAFMPPPMMSPIKSELDTHAFFT